MTPYQLDESANAPCTRTMVGLVGCAVAAAPASKRPTDVRIAAKIFILSFPFFLHSAKDRVSGPSCDQGARIHVMLLPAVRPAASLALIAIVCTCLSAQPR